MKTNQPQTEQSLFNYLSHHFRLTLTKEQEQYILTIFTIESFKKKDILFRCGDANTRHYIVKEGLLRLYLIDTNGKEINLLFARENQIIGDLITPEPTDFFLEATEDTTVYSIDDKSFRKLIRDLEIQTYADPQYTMRRSYIKIRQRLVSLLSKSAEENYLEFKKQYPDLIRRLPQYHIASYLGISAEFLSKIITKTTKQK